MFTLQSTNTDAELSNLLSAYLLGWKTLHDCHEWFSGVNWEEIDATSKLASIIGDLDLLCTEASEGLRPESDFERRVSDVVASISCVRYFVAKSNISSGSSSDTIYNRAGFMITAGDQASPFWNISPQVELA